MLGRVLTFAALFWLAPFAATTSHAASPAPSPYPDRPVSYIIPFGAGGESSIAAKLQVPVFQSLTGQDLVISYRPGGGGAVVWSELNSMPADGYTIVGINLPHIILQPMLGAKYKTSGITGIYIFHYTPDAIVVSDDSPFETLNELREYAKENPNQITFSGSGRGTANHLAQIQFDKLGKIETKYRAYKGTAASIQALISEQVDASWGYTTVGTKYEGDVRLLAVATEERHAQFPDVPTFRELGFDMVGGAYRGIAVPKKTPEKIRNQLSEIFARINANPDLRQEMVRRGFAVVDIPYPKIDAFMKRQTETYKALAERAGLVR